MSAAWKVDLLKKYLRDSKGKASGSASWYKWLDHDGSLTDRQKVYEMLTKQASESNPSNVRESRIPWNQRSTGWMTAFQKMMNLSEKKSELGCGTVVKVTFQRYMGWAGQEKGKAISKDWKASEWIASSLDAGKPVRAYMRAHDHYIGIVGYRVPKEHEFLCIDPWPGGASTGTTTIIYEGMDTKFLGIAKQNGWKIEYDGHALTRVEGFHRFR